MGRGKDYKDLMEQMTLVTQLGLTMAGCIVFCFAVGFWLDRWLGLKGVFLAIFTILGVIGGGYVVYRQINQLTNDDDNDQIPPI